MLGTGQTDSFRSEADSLLGVVGCIGIGANLENTNFISPAHKGSEITRDFRINGCNLRAIDISGGSVQGDVILIGIELVASLNRTIGFVDNNGTTAGYAAGSHTSGNNRCMRSHSAANGQNSFSGNHAFDIFG
ncbi:hypothetical protein SDC9_167344 [bioreactor metagenome]|uniref:Uncharacterized protein n=1 Tax=bioreactor metagenome TaxID=1076179 RepID=A0A645G2D0_9ZZZZ